LLLLFDITSDHHMLKFSLSSWLTLLIFAAGCGNGANKQPPAPQANPSMTQRSDTGSPRQPGTGRPAEPGTGNIVFFGNSLTAGYGVQESEAFPALIRRRIDSLRLPYTVINAGLSGETSAGGKNRVGWIIRQPVAIFVLELGANDGLRGIPVAGTIANLQAIIDSVKEKYPSAKILLAGMKIPPSMGNEYASAFSAAFRQLATRNKVYLIPFILEGVGGVPELNQSDGIHPTAKGHTIVAKNVWNVLKELL
jgi:acyl-CoA thioesterase I